LNWLFALVFLGSQFLGDKTIVERMMGHAVSAPQLIWRRLNMGWVGFFLGVGIANIYVAYTFSEAIWVDFKLFGLLGLTLVFVLGQALYLARYMEPDGRET
jgi:intracellular septation protein